MASGWHKECIVLTYSEQGIRWKQNITLCYAMLCWAVSGHAVYVMSLCYGLLGGELLSCMFVREMEVGVFVCTLGVWVVCTCRFGTRCNAQSAVVICIFATMTVFSCILCLYIHIRTISSYRKIYRCLVFHPLQSDTETACKPSAFRITTPCSLGI